MNKYKWSVLVFPGGTEVGLEVWRSLSCCKEVCLTSVSSDTQNHAAFVFSNHYTIKDVRCDGWFEELVEIIQREKIDFIYPTNALVIDALILKRDQIPCRLVLAPSDLVLLTRSKRRTLTFLQDIIHTPKMFESASAVDSFPVFIKPDSLYGAQGAYIVESRIQLEEIVKQKTDILIQEYLTGEEYTVDCFSNSSGALQFSAPRIRGRIRMGTTMHSCILSGTEAGELIAMAQKISNKLRLPGAWFFQVKRNSSGKFALLEVEARIAGTMCLNRVRGVNFPLLSLYLAAGHDIEILVNDTDYTLDRALINRYRSDLSYEVVYIDLDDTIICKGKLNLDIVRFLYQCVNKGKKLILLSKSTANEPVEVLRQYRLSSLFDEVIWLTENEKKSDYIDPVGAIFIDDSFSQRKEVHSRLGIPTFDASMIEGLLDYRSN